MQDTYLNIVQTTMAPTPSKIKGMPVNTKHAIMCLSARLFLRALRALRSILLRGASSRVVGTSGTGWILFTFFLLLFSTFLSPYLPAELILLRTCSSGLRGPGWGNIL